MTYGDTGRPIRAELTTLLRHHRIQMRLGGLGGSPLVPATTTVEQRQQLGKLLQRYRYATLTWCLNAVVAADPRENLARTNERDRGPAEDLRFRLRESIRASEVGMPSLRELSAPQDFPLVDSWRKVAQAAVLGENDFPGLMDHGRLTVPQCAAVLKDAADVTRALVVLDRRYDQVPGWGTLYKRGRLDRAAEVVCLFADYVEPDYAVDQRRWRPPPATIDGEALPGIAGVLQAEHNMLVHLAQFPNALNLRRVIDAQRLLSHAAARRAPNVAPDLIERWLERELVYSTLIKATRNIGGLVGGGGLAVAEAANAVSRMRHVPVEEEASAEQLRDLGKLFTRVDARIASVIEQGVAERLYFVSVKLPRIVDESFRLVNPVRERYVPITSPVQTDLLAIARHDLRPAVPRLTPAEGAGNERERLTEAISHRPPGSGAPAR